MRVKKVTANGNETSATLDLFEGLDLSDKTKSRIQEDVGTYLVEQSLMSISEGKSPVQGESIPALKRGPYKTKKEDELGTGRADLQFSGETLDEFSFSSTKDGIKIGVFGDKAPVFDGHNNISGKSDLPRRRIIPGEGQSYKGSIAKEVDRIIADAVAEDSRFKARDFSGVTTQKGLLEILKTKIGPLSKTELSLAVYRNEKLLDLLNDLGLLKLLP